MLVCRSLNIKWYKSHTMSQTYKVNQKSKIITPNRHFRCQNLSRAQTRICLQHSFTRNQNADCDGRVSSLCELIFGIGINQYKRPGRLKVSLHTLKIMSWNMKSTSSVCPLRADTVKMFPAIIRRVSVRVKHELWNNLNSCQKWGWRGCSVGGASISHVRCYFNMV